MIGFTTPARRFIRLQYILFVVLTPDDPPTATFRSPLGLIVLMMFWEPDKAMKTHVSASSGKPFIIALSFCAYLESIA